MELSYERVTIADIIWGREVFRREKYSVVCMIFNALVFSCLCIFVHGWNVFSNYYTQTQTIGEVDPS